MTRPKNGLNGDTGVAGLGARGWGLSRAGKESGLLTLRHTNMGGVIIYPRVLERRANEEVELYKLTI